MALNRVAGWNAGDVDGGHPMVVFSGHDSRADVPAGQHSTENLHDQSQPIALVAAVEKACTAQWQVRSGL